MKYSIIYIERGLDVQSDKYLLDMCLETDKTKLVELSDKFNPHNNWTVEAENLADLFKKYNKILHKGAQIMDCETGVVWIVMQQGMLQADPEIEYWESSHKTNNVGEFIIREY